MEDLEQLLTEARDADPGDRINLRDPIAAHGEVAIDAMTDWLGDSRLAAFAIRVLERIGREPAGWTAVERRGNGCSLRPAQTIRLALRRRHQ